MSGQTSHTQMDTGPHATAHEMSEHHQWNVHIKNSLVGAIDKISKFTHATFILRSLHWLKINRWIEYTILSYLHTSLYHATQLPYL